MLRTRLGERHRIQSFYMQALLRRLRVMSPRCACTDVYSMPMVTLGNENVREQTISTPGKISEHRPRECRISSPEIYETRRRSRPLFPRLLFKRQIYFKQIFRLVHTFPQQNEECRNAYILPIH